MYKNYSKIGKFGDCLLINTNYGYDVCMVDGIDKCFAKGPGPVDNLGPSAPNCQAFLAEQCSIEWNPKCELYYRTHKQSLERNLPNTFEGMRISNMSLLKKRGVCAKEQSGHMSNVKGRAVHSMLDTSPLSEPRNPLFF